MLAMTENTHHNHYAMSNYDNVRNHNNNNNINNRVNMKTKTSYTNIYDNDNTISNTTTHNVDKKSI